MLSPTDRFESYVIDGVLGRGGYATVYRAHRAAEPGSAVALKVLDDEHRHQAQVARLRREFDFANGLEHPHIVTVYDRGAGWLSMEVLSGGSIVSLDTTSNRLAALAEIADALDYTHNHGIVHCDIKPTNIVMRQSNSDAVLIDFGIAQAITDDIGRRPDHVEASLPYAAPELLTGHAPTDATDEYALACTTVELLTGRPPFTAETRYGLIDAQLRRPPPQRSREFRWLPRIFDSIIAKALSKDPKDRYRSCREFVSLISRVLK